MNKASEILKAKIQEFDERRTNPKKNISTEFQDFGYRLALRLNDLPHKAIYIKYAKVVPRALMEDAAVFASDYPNAKNKGKIFMWKLHELITEYKEKHPDFRLSVPKKNGKNSINNSRKRKISTNLQLL